MTVEELVKKINNSIILIKGDKDFLNLVLRDYKQDGLSKESDQFNGLVESLSHDECLIKEREIALKVINQFRGINDES